MTDQLSNKITNLSGEIENSDSLWSNDPLRRKVRLEALLTCYLPTRSSPIAVTPPLLYHCWMHISPHRLGAPSYCSSLPSCFFPPWVSDFTPGDSCFPGRIGWLRQDHRTSLTVVCTCAICKPTRQPLCVRAGPDHARVCLLRVRAGPARRTVDHIGTQGQQRKSSLQDTPTRENRTTCQQCVCIRCVHIR